MDRAFRYGRKGREFDPLLRYYNEDKTMASVSGIDWTESTWNPIVGCRRVSPGCVNCYAEREAAQRLAHTEKYKGLSIQTPTGPRWTGEVRFIEKDLNQPLRWQKPRMIFVCSMSDLFHEDVPWEWIDKMFAVMAMSPRHTFQVLTKRAVNMRDYVLHGETPQRIATAILALASEVVGSTGSKKKLERYFDFVKIAKSVEDESNWPLKNVWKGISAEDQATLNERLPLLMQTFAAIRWVSAEPLLGDLDFEKVPELHNRFEINTNWLSWVVGGGESGAGARPMNPNWVRSLRDQCVARGIPFFFKQWGEWGDLDSIDATGLAHHGWWEMYPEDGGVPTKEWEGPILNGVELASQRPIVYRVGKKAAGRLLDGRLWEEYPEAVT